MSSLRNPVGPQPPAVYWRRRLLVLLGIIAVVIVIVLIIARPGSGTPSAGPSNSPNPSGSASPSGSATPGAGDGSEACDPSVIQLDPITDAASYPANVQPMISMKITNTGAAACTYDVGTDAQEYLIMSGSDRIWDSKDCQTGAAPTPLVLQPNTPQSTTPFPWDRTRSSTTTCNTDRPQVTGGGATYRLSVLLGEAKSDGDLPFILE